MTYYLAVLVFAGGFSGAPAIGQFGPYVGLLACQAAAIQIEATFQSHSHSGVVTVCTAERVQPLTWNGKELKR